LTKNPDRIEQIRRAVEEAAAGDAKAALESALAEQLIAHGEYAEALVQLGSARRGAQAGAVREHVERMMGLALVRRGEIDRAEPHLERALDAAEGRGDDAQAAAVLVLLGEVYRRRGELERAEGAFERARAGLDKRPDRELEARWQIGRAATALALDRADEAVALALAACEGAQAEVAAAARTEALLVLADAHRRKKDPASAERILREAIAVAGAAGLPRELAEAYYAYAHLIGGGGAALQVGRDPPAAWLARAQDLFRDHGALADLERVREAFRKFGRRATDHVAAVEVKGMIDDLRSARLTVAREAHRLVDAVDVAVARLDGETPQPARARLTELTRSASQAEQAVASSVETMSSAEARVFAAMQSIISERENIRTLLDLCRSLNELHDYARLISEIAKMAAQLTGADRALVAAISPSRAIEIKAAWHMPVLDGETDWMTAIEHVARGGGPLLVEGDLSSSKRGAEELKLGHALVTPLRQGEKLYGAVYADKELCGGVFTPHDLDLLAIFSTQAATMLENARAAGQLRLAARSRAATLEAISDGVLSFDRAGALTSINNVAARILGFGLPSAGQSSSQLPSLGSLSLATMPDLGFLRASLERGEDLDGRVTRVGAADYLLNFRILRTDAGEAVGAVATLAEMKRVQSIAQRIVGSQARYSFGDLIGQAPSLRRRLQLAEAAARSDSTVLVTGESGTGKEVLAQAIHNASARAAGPFVGINCSAIPRELLESELFGYEGGAFTGAKKGGHPGKFELADGGTILLDEIGDMPIEMQSKLLRVLQERRVHRIGGTREVTLDARVIATTNRDLDEMVSRGHFRSDLLFRLKVIHIPLPPLRERAIDIPILVGHFLSLFAARLGKKVRALSPEVMDAFARYPWPGNIRELENVLEGEVNLAEAEQELLDEIPDGLRGRRAAQASMGAAAPAGGEAALRTLDEAEKELLTQALTLHSGSIPDVARTLGISRGTVYNMMRRFAVDAEQFRGKD
jgi:transcriptional regulator with PAS, ATPase and Fis domain/tetratricopeptide (TPR) repeat protein